MSFQPVLPLGGYAGWAFLKRTMVRQQDLQQSAPANLRDEAYFRQKIGKIGTAADLVSDRRLLRISLTAFGLEGDLNNKAFIQKILEGGTLKEGSLANRLANKQYLKLSAAFGFGDFSVPSTKLSDFPDKIIAQHQERIFETAVGAQQNTYRLALNAEREVPTLAKRGLSDVAHWYSVLGNPPLREVFQTAFGLPKSFASIDLDQQVAVLQRRTETAFGSEKISQFAEPQRLDALIRRFLVRSDLADQGKTASPAAVALQLLRR
jgi:hypothetical protein